MDRSGEACAESSSCSAMRRTRSSETDRAPVARATETEEERPERRERRRGGGGAAWKGVEQVAAHSDGSVSPIESPPLIARGLGLCVASVWTKVQNSCS